MTQSLRNVKSDKSNKNDSETVKESNSSAVFDNKNVSKDNKNEAPK